MAPMSNPGDDGSWTPQNDPHASQDPYGQPAPGTEPGQDPYAAPGVSQDPWAQPPAGQAVPGQPAQDPFAPQDAHGQQNPYDPYGGQSSHGPQDPYGQQGQTGQPSPYGPASGASASEPGGSDPSDGGQWSAAPGAGADPYGQAFPYGVPAGDQGVPQGDPTGGQGAPYADGSGAPVQGEPQSRVLVGVLGIFLGGFGVHRFLMGYTTIGIIQIIVTVVTCGIGAWWGIIEGIMVLARAQAFERDAHGRPLKD